MAEWPDDASTNSARSLGQNAQAANTKHPDAIRAGISETRERLSDTLSELGERLNPQLVKEQVTERVKEGIRDATIGRIEHMARSAADTVNTTRTGIVDTIRENPVPAAMVAVGLGWLFFNGRRSESQSSRQWNQSRGYDTERSSGSYPRSSSFAGGYAYDAESGGSSGDESGLSRTVDGVRERVSGAAESVKERAGNLADRGRDLADRAGTRASSIASSVSDRAQDVAGSVKQRTTQSARRVEDSFFENPLAVGAITMALGVVAGLAAPVTDREVQLMGDARERVVDRVKDVANEAKDKAQHVADRVMGEAKQAAGRVVDEAKRAAKDEGLTGHNTATSPTQSPYANPGLGLS